MNKGMQEWLIIRMLLGFTWCWIVIYRSNPVVNGDIISVFCVSNQ